MPLFGLSFRKAVRTAGQVVQIHEPATVNSTEIMSFYMRWISPHRSKVSVYVEELRVLTHAGMPEWSKGPDSSTRDTHILRLH